MLELWIVIVVLTAKMHVIGISNLGCHYRVGTEMDERGKREAIGGRERGRNGWMDEVYVIRLRIWWGSTCCVPFCVVVRRINFKCLIQLCAIWWCAVVFVRLFDRCFWPLWGGKVVMLLLFYSTFFLISILFYFYFRFCCIRKTNQTGSVV